MPATLVSGGAGYIGSHVAVALAAAGREIVCIDNYVNSSPAAVERLRGRGLAGTPDELLEGFGRLAEVGVERVALQHIVHEDLDTVALLGQVAARA